MKIGKISGGSAAGGAGGITMLPDTTGITLLPATGGFLPLDAGLHAIIIFVAAFTLIAAGLALWNIVPRKER